MSLRQRTLWGPKITKGAQYRGDRLRAERLLYEHGMNTNFRADLDPEEVEVMAAMGKLDTYYTDSHCSSCGAKWDDDCDLGVHA